MSPSSRQPIPLVFQWWGGDAGVLLRKSDEDRIPKILEAVNDSSSWDELRARLRDLKAVRLVQCEPEDNEPYAPERVAPEGGLPLTLIMTMVLRARIPEAIQAEFGEVVGSPVAGAWPEYEFGRLDELRQALQKHGFELAVIRRDGELPPWIE